MSVQFVRRRVSFVGFVPWFLIVLLLGAVATARVSNASDFQTLCSYPTSLPLSPTPVFIEVTVTNEAVPVAGALVRAEIEVLDGSLDPRQVETQVVGRTYLDGRVFLTFLHGVLGKGTVRFVVSVNEVPACESEPYEIDSVPKLVLHVQQRSPGSCEDWPVWTPCSGYSTAGATGATYDIYLVAARIDPMQGVGGVSLGIAYDTSIDVRGWRLCTDAFYYPTGEERWPASGSGVRITWPCPNGSMTSFEEDGLHAPVAIFTVYANGGGIMEITPNRDFDPPELIIPSCGYPIWNLEESDLGRLAFSPSGTEAGFNPCRPNGPVIPPPPPPSPPPPPPPPAPPEGMDVLLHIIPASLNGDLCTSVPSATEQIVTSAEASPEGLDYVVYLLGTEGMGGIQAGITFDADSPGERGVAVHSWQACADLEFPQTDWPASGTGNTLTWANCVETRFVASGFFRVTAYAPSVLAIMGYPRTGRIKVATCNAEEFVLEEARDVARFAWLSMGGAAIGTDVGGCNPLVEACRGAANTPVRSISWGRLKALYGK